MAKKKKTSGYHSTKEISIADSLLQEEDRANEKEIVVDIKGNADEIVLERPSLLDNSLQEVQEKQPIQKEEIETVVITPIQDSVEPVSTKVKQETKTNTVSIKSAAKKVSPIIAKTSLDIIEESNAVAAEKTDLTNYEVVEIISLDTYIDKKALTNVYVRNTPEKVGGNIDRILNKGETITLIVDYDNAIWAKTKDGKYIMKEFLG